MTNSKDSVTKKVLALLSDYTLSEGAHGTMIACREAGYVNLEHLHEGLTNAGYLQARRAIRSDEEQVEVTLILDESAWEDSSPEAYLSVKDMWESYRTGNKTPEHFIVPDSVYDSAINFRKSFNTYLKVKQLLIAISDHDTEVGSVLLFHYKKDSIRKEEISLNITFDELIGVELSSDKETAIEDLLKRVTLEEDAHSQERQNVLKNVIIEELEKKNFSEFFSLLYNASCALATRYKEQYKVYVDRFSVNKILNDINEKNLEYSAKINEFISSSQTKAFTIPGAIIAVGALVRTGVNLWSLVLIVFGLFMIRSFVRSANELYRESFDHLLRQVSYIFDRFYELDDSTKVHKYARDSKKEVSERIGTAKARLDKIDFYSTLMLLVGLLFLLLKIIESFTYFDISIFIEQYL